MQQQQQTQTHRFNEHQLEIRQQKQLQPFRRDFNQQQHRNSILARSNAVGVSRHTTDSV